MVAGGDGAVVMVRRGGGRLQRRRTGEMAGDGAQGKEAAEERNTRGGGHMESARRIVPSLIP
jgi:hypothetical protein